MRMLNEYSRFVKEKHSDDTGSSLSGSWNIYWRTLYCGFNRDYEEK